MKYNLHIITILLAVALVVLSVKITFNNETTNSTESSTSAIETIMTRSSVRSYSDKKVEDDKIETMLRAAMAAPTAGNKQPWAFVVVKDTVTLNKFGEKLPYAKMASEAPLSIVVCGDLSKGFEGIASQYWIQDASAAMQNMLLAAHSLGLGAVWTGVFPIEERVAAVKELLNLPEHIIPLGVTPIGYPDSEPNVKDKWKPENVKYENWK